MPHVFVSYVRENRDVVDCFCSSLRENHIEVWLDREQLQPGQRWREAIRSAISRGAFFIACFSREYTARERSYMNEELTLAVEELRLRPTSRSWFIPVLLSGDQVPDRSIGGGETLRDLHWVDLASDWDAGVRAIVRAIKGSTDTPQANLSPAQLDPSRSAASGGRSVVWSVKLAVCIFYDLFDFTIGRVLFFYGTPFGEVIGCGLCCALFGVRGLLYGLEALDMTEQFDAYIPAATIIALKNKPSA